MNEHKKKHPVRELGSEFEVKRDPNKKNVCHEWHSREYHIERRIDELLQERAARAEDELIEGFRAIRHYPKSVTFFGSARFAPEHPYYQRAKKLAARICKEEYAVITGGGPGIMAAGNEGSNGSCDQAIGFNIELPEEQVINEHVTHGVNFNYFFTRKVALAFSAEAYLFFPGGYGTLDEFFEIATLVQTKKLPPVPMILVGRDFWEPIIALCRTLLLERFETISPEDLDIFTIVDDDDEIIEIIKNAPLRNEYHN